MRTNDINDDNTSKHGRFLLHAKSGTGKVRLDHVGGTNRVCLLAIIYNGHHPDGYMANIDGVMITL